jgi:hypothetical protein
MLKNMGFPAISILQASPGRSVGAAIPIKTASLNHQTQHSAFNLSKITSAQR